MTIEYWLKYEGFGKIHLICNMYWLMFWFLYIEIWGFDKRVTLYNLWMGLISVPNRGRNSIISHHWYRPIMFGHFLLPVPPQVDIRIGNSILSYVTQFRFINQTVIFSGFTTPLNKVRPQKHSKFLDAYISLVIAAFPYFSWTSDGGRCHSFGHHWTEGRVVVWK